MSTQSSPQIQRQPMLELAGITKKYGKHKAVDDVTLTIESGEFVTLLGPSGSGKTTCLRIIAGMVTPEHGNLSIAGQDVSSIPMHKRNIGMVFQSYTLFPHMTVAQNVAYPLRVRGHDRHTAQAAVTEMLTMVGLKDFGDRRPTELSGGQQQRVALARALVFKPDVLLLDEPLSALDRILRESMQLELRRIHESTGTTTICVTHDRTEALAMSDRVIVLRDGRIIQDATPQEIYQRSDSRFVAEFLGETNVIPVDVARAGAQLHLRDVAGNALVFDPSAAPDVGDQADLVFRVENVSLSVPGGAGASGWPGTVTEAVFLGDSVRYTVQCGSQAIVARIPITAVVPAIVRGTDVLVGIDTTSAMLFGEQSEVPAAKQSVSS